MTAPDLAAHFEQFLESISIGYPQIPRMESAAATISSFLRSSYSLPSEAVFLQGSYPNGTAVEPVEDGEYDLDIVCVCVGGGLTADQALDDLTRRFESDGRFRDRIIAKKPCVRLEYAEDDVGKFHVDVVPVHPTAKPSPPLEAPRRGEGWHGTAPAEYTAWCLAQGDLYARTVKAAKRWRDEQQTVRQAIKSIVLQVLVAEHMPSESSDAGRLAATFRNMHAALGSLTAPPVVTNPVLPIENLAKRWSSESFASFQKELKEAVEWSQKAVTTTDVIEAADAWRELLGNDFPTTPPTQLGFKLGSISHAQRPSDMGWSESLSTRYSVTIGAEMQRGARSHHRKPLENDGALVFANSKLHFRAKVAAPNHVEVWWQVANTGAHARSKSGLRGEIFKGRDLKKRPIDQAENWEDTSYTGSHVIRALLVRGDAVVAKSDWFRVNIYSPRVPFSL
jgi:hypothetical protein